MIERLMDPELLHYLQTTDDAVLRASTIPGSGDIGAWADERRAARAKMAAARPSMRTGLVTVVDRRITGAPGAPEVPVRIYTPAGGGGPRPGLLWLYGGAWMFGSLDDFEDMYLSLAEQLDAVVVGVDYRKAPQDPHPAGVEDCYAALCWMAEEAPSLGFEADRLSVGGGSAGGNFTAALTLMARDRRGPAIASQLPLYAALDERVVTPSSRAIEDPRIVSRVQYERAWQHHLGPKHRGDAPPYAAPFRAADLSGLPPAYMMVGGLDPMCDENVWYATRLMQAGVSVELHVYPGAFHGFTGIVPTAAVSRRAQADLMEALRRAVRRRSAPAVGSPT